MVFIAFFVNGLYLSTVTVNCPLTQKPTHFEKEPEKIRPKKSNPSDHVNLKDTKKSAKISAISVICVKLVSHFV